MLYVLMAVRDDARDLERLLPVLATRLGPRRCRVVIVDDGSRDDTARVVRRFAGLLDAWLVPHVRPRGRAAALGTGLELVLEDARSEDDLVVTVDPRHRGAAAELAQLLTRVEAPPLPPDANAAPLRRFLRRLARPFPAACRAGSVGSLRGAVRRGARGAAVAAVAALAASS